MSTINDVEALRHLRGRSYHERVAKIVTTMRDIDAIVALQLTEIAKLRADVRKITDDWNKERTTFVNRVTDLGNAQEYLLAVMENIASASVWEEVIIELDLKP